ncbi:MAG: carboxypeptidase-like regulatory domain-containing protein [Ferruginibacter sp.]
MQTDFNHKQWGVADFERYHSGKMPEAESHALEKAALDDPFLQDALDGYEFTQTPQDDIAYLKEKLWPAADKTPVVAIPWYRTTLFRAAAVVMVFAGIGIMYLNRDKNNSPDADKEIAVTNLNKAKGVDSSVNSYYNLDDSAPVIAKLDKEVPKPSAGLVPGEQNNNAPVNQQAEDAEQKASEAEELARNDDRAKEKQAYTPVPKYDIANKKETNKDGIADKIAAAPVQNNRSQVSGRVVNQQGEPVPYAVLKNNADNRQQVASDLNGNFVMNNANTPANSNSVPLEVNAAGYESAKQNLANNSSNNTIVLNQADSITAEVTGGAKGRKEKYQWNGRNSHIQLRNAKPLEGWDYFYYVMNDSISRNTALMQHKGKMILTFDTNDDGKVQNITVKKSVNNTADSIASRILSKSPILEITNRQRKGEAVIRLD